MPRVTPSRRYAKAYVGMLSDPDFLLLEAEERQLFMALWIRPETSNAGVGPWAPEHMAHLIGASATPEDVRRVAATLQIRKYVHVDETTGEVLVRSYIRHDDVVRQPNMVKPMVAAFHATRSATLRQMIVNELHRLRAEFVPRPGKLDGFQTAPLAELLRKHPATVEPARLAAWAAHNPYRKVAATPADDFMPAPAAPAWTPADDFPATPAHPAAHPVDLGEGLGGRVGGNPSPNPSVKGPGEGLGGTHAGRDGVTTTTDIREIEDVADPAGPRTPSLFTGDPDGVDGAVAAGGQDPERRGSVRFLTGLPLDVEPVLPPAKTDPNGPYTAEFERFWAAWHRHGEKRPAFKAWCKAMREGVPNDLLISRAVPTFNARMADRYVRQAHTWLSNRGWENDPGKPVRDRAGDVAAGLDPDPGPEELRRRERAAGQRPAYRNPVTAEMYDVQFGAGRASAPSTQTTAEMYDVQFGAGRARAPRPVTHTA